MVTEKYPGDMIKFLQDYYGDRPLVGAEIGVLNGDHALKLLESLNIQTLYLIDPYEAYPEYHDHNRSGVAKARERAVRRLEPYEAQIRWLFMQSELAVGFITIEHLGGLHFSYADGNHSKPYVYKDLWRFLPLISDDGVTGGHDFYTRKDPDNLCEVEEVVTEFAEISNSILYLDGATEASWPDWWFIKDPDMMHRINETTQSRWGIKP